MKNKIFPIARWILAVFFVLMAVGNITKSIIAGLLFMIAAFIISPLSDKLPQIPDKYKEKTRYRVATVIILFFAGALTIPTDDKGDDEYTTTPDRSIVTEDITTEPETSELAENTTATTTFVTTDSSTTTNTATTTTATTTSTTTAATTTAPARKILHFVLNTDSHCVHINPQCPAAEAIVPENRSEIDIYEDELGTYSGVYWACGRCSNRYRDALYPLSDD